MRELEMLTVESLGLERPKIQSADSRGSIRSQSEGISVLAASGASKGTKVASMGDAKVTDAFMADKPTDNDSSAAHRGRPSLPRDESFKTTMSEASMVPSGSAPASNVLVSSGSFVRDLSDLSGSCANNRNLKSKRTTETIVSYLSDHSASSHTRPWAQAIILSSRQPSHPQPPTDCDDSVGLTSRKMQTTILHYDDGNGLVETVMSSSREEVSTAASDTMALAHKRTPIVILLMDPARKIYELMQLWIDIQVDAVRDVVQSMQQHLSDKADWKTDYDGLFQVRNDALTQLIHVVGVSRLDPQPYEVFVAKPWSMSSKSTRQHASELLLFLQQVQMLQPSHLDESASQLQPNNPYTRSDDAVLRLSTTARSRIYVPEGVLSHYHACQFLSFSPPFEPHSVRPIVCLDVLGGTLPDIGADDDASVLTVSVCDPEERSMDERTLGKSHDCIRLDPTIFHTVLPDEPTKHSRGDVALTIKSMERQRLFSSWACCWSHRQVDFVIDCDGGRLSNEFDCATPPMEDSVYEHSGGDSGDEEDDASKTDVSNASASLPLMFNRPTETTQWTKHVVNKVK